MKLSEWLIGFALFWNDRSGINYGQNTTNLRGNKNSLFAGAGYNGQWVRLGGG
jgi:hypothetical protein